MANEANTTVTEIANTMAENNGGDPTQAVSSHRNENAVSTSAEGQTAKTFTQQEVDDIVKARLERAARGQPAKEELARFREWESSQKNAEQLTAEKISAAEKSLEEANAKILALTKGVKAEAADDVLAHCGIKYARCKFFQRLHSSAQSAEYLPHLPP